MGLVNNQRVVSNQIAIAGEFCQQNTVGHQLDGTGVREGVVEANLVTHQFTQWRVQFVGDTLRHCARSNAAGLGVTNALPAPPAQTKTDFWELGGFS